MATKGNTQCVLLLHGELADHHGGGGDGVRDEGNGDWRLRDRLENPQVSEAT